MRASRWGRTPRQTIEEECRRRGRDAVVAACVELLQGGEADPDLVVALAGPAARWALADERADRASWLRVWAARGLLWAWDASATEAVVAALDDEAWRVREMALKVVARHRVEAALPRLGDRQDDPVPRVRRAAERALVRVTDGG